jgi:plastocyanin
MSIMSHGVVRLAGYANIAFVMSAIILSAAIFIIASTPGRAATANVGISDSTPTLFSPQVLTINVGDTVIWTCQDGAHTTSSNNNSATEIWDSGTLGEGQTFTYTFTTTGNFSYVSEASGDQGDIGYIVVLQPAPEFPGFVLYVTVAAAVLLAFLVERRLRA